MGSWTFIGPADPCEAPHTKNPAAYPGAWCGILGPWAQVAYQEQAEPEAFFVPLAWDLVQAHSGPDLAWTAPGPGAPPAAAAPGAH